MKQRYMVIDVAMCFDCNNCFMACKDEYAQLDTNDPVVGTVENEWSDSAPQPRHGHRWMDIQRRERGQYPRIDVAYLPTPCQHCEDAPCQKAYPQCVTRREDGIVLIDKTKARDVKGLVSSCPYGAIYWNEEICTPQKCTMCAHILDSGENPGMPRCAHSCPTEAIKFYTMEPAEMEKKVRDEGLEVYRPELNTKPHVFYKNLYRFEKAFVSGELLRGGECAEGVTVSLKGEGLNETRLTDCFGEFKFDALSPGAYTLYAGGKELQTVQVQESVNIGEISLD